MACTKSDGGASEPVQPDVERLEEESERNTTTYLVEQRIGIISRVKIHLMAYWSEVQGN